MATPNFPVLDGKMRRDGILPNVAYIWCLLFAKSPVNAFLARTPMLNVVLQGLLEQDVVGIRVRK